MIPPIILVGSALLGGLGWYAWTHTDENQIIGRWHADSPTGKPIDFEFRKDHTLSANILPGMAVTWQISGDKLATTVAGQTVQTSYKLIDSNHLRLSTPTGETITLTRV